METGFGSRELKSVFLFSDGEKINWYVFLPSLSRLAFCGIISPKRCNIFADSINADREATDYKHTYRQVTSDDKLQIHLAPGGGWTAIVE